MLVVIRTICDLVSKLPERPDESKRRAALMKLDWRRRLRRSLRSLKQVKPHSKAPRLILSAQGQRDAYEFLICRRRKCRTGSTSPSYRFGRIGIFFGTIESSHGTCCRSTRGGAAKNFKTLQGIQSPN